MHYTTNIWIFFHVFHVFLTFNYWNFVIKIFVLRSSQVSKKTLGIINKRGFQISIKGEGVLVEKIRKLTSGGTFIWHSKVTIIWEDVAKLNYGILFCTFYLFAEEKHNWTDISHGIMHLILTQNFPKN